MFYIYVLKSQRDGKLYIGYTNNLKRRIEEHHTKRVFSTKGRTPFNLVYYEAFLSREDATEREQKLKEFKSSYGQLKKRIKRSVDIEPRKRG